MTSVIFALVAFVLGLSIMYLRYNWWLKLEWYQKVKITDRVLFVLEAFCIVCIIAAAAMVAYAAYLTWFVEPPEIPTQELHCDKQCQVFVMNDDDQCMVVSVYFPNGDFRYPVKVLNVNSNTIALTIKTSPVVFEHCRTYGSIRAWPGEKGVIDLQSFDLYIER